MIDPRLALALFAGALLLAAALFWPSSGLWHRLVRRLRTGERESLEDALKHLYKTERRGAAPSLESVAGSLGVPLAQAARIVEALGDRGLVQPSGALTLTDEGQAYALQVIRTHRLWERYLADRTGTAPSDWHARAEMREHEISPAQADRIAASLGHPRYDPHGDPIPTASGEIPEPAGTPLPYLAEGDTATVIHVEDEPRALYHRLAAAGVSPGLRLRVVAAGGGRMTVEFDGRRQEFDLATAGNVTVVTGDEQRIVEDPASHDYRTLEDLEAGEEAEVLGLAPACQGIQRRRLLDLGVVPGTRVRAELVSPGGDPTAYEVRGALIALRRDQQRWVRIRPAREQAA